MFDFGYLARVITLLWRLKGKKKTKDIFSDFIVHGRCWLNDLDTNWHMNNARYLRECDFGRFSLLIETGLWDALVQRRKNGYKEAAILVSALQVQYRQSVELGDKFEIRTRINGWDDRAFYLEQSMILDKNKETVFSLLVRVALTPRSLTPQMLIDDLQIGSIQSPTLSPHMQILQQNYKLNFQDIKSKL
jgi:YbgC/YbaW family acyl-CoA thioester hydrolase